MTRFRPAVVCSAIAAALLAGALTACSPLGLVNAVSPAGAAHSTTAIAYAPGARGMLDVYTPAASAAARGKPAPVIVFFYGGNWVSGKREDYAFVGRALAARGFVVVIPDYRLYPQVRYPDFLVDSAQAVAWTERTIAQYGGDPRRVYLMGHSAGAYNAAMLALDSRWLGREGLRQDSLRGWIGLAGPYDFLPIQNQTTRPVFDWPDTPPDSQPASHVGRDAPPALLIAPRRDETVDPVRNTGALAARLRAAGVPVTEAYYDGVGHATLVASLSNSLRRLAPTLDAVAAFVGRDGANANANANVSSAGSGRRTADRDR